VKFTVLHLDGWCTISLCLLTYLDAYPVTQLFSAEDLEVVSIRVGIRETERDANEQGIVKAVRDC
jgi:hypothetical protein